MNASEFDGLKADIKIRGLRVPIIIFEDTILDGRNRYLACKALGVTPMLVDYEGDDPLNDVIAWNLTRRHLNESQRAMVAANLATLKKGGVRAGQNTWTSQSTNLYSEVSRLEAAQRLNVSTSLVSNAKKLKKEAIIPLIDLVTLGDITINTAAAVAVLPQDQQATLVKQGVEAVKTAAKQVREALNISRQQGNRQHEWYTPENVIMAAKACFGGVIDTDPASCALANITVQATTYYTEEENGLNFSWHKKVFCNPPYSQPELSLFVDKLISEYECGNVTEAILLVHNYTDSNWFHRALQTCNAVCFSKGRLRFTNPENIKAQCTQGQVLLYFGNDRFKFADSFNDIGTTLLCNKY